MSVSRVVAMLKSADLLTQSVSQERVEAIMRESLTPHSNPDHRHTTELTLSASEFGEFLVRFSHLRMQILADGNTRMHSKATLPNGSGALDAPTLVKDDAPINGPQSSLAEALSSVVSSLLTGCPRSTLFRALSDLKNDRCVGTVLRNLEKPLRSVFDRYVAKSSSAAAQTNATPVIDAVAFVNCGVERKWLSGSMEHASKTGMQQLVSALFDSVDDNRVCTLSFELFCDVVSVIAVHLRGACIDPGADVSGGAVLCASARVKWFVTHCL